MVKKDKDNALEMIIQDKLSLSDPWYQLVMEMIQSVIHEFDGRRLIEVGCGLGGFVMNAAQKGAVVIGLDVSLNAVNTAKGLVKQLGLQDKVDLVVGDAQFLPFKEQVSDVVICSETLEHVPDYEKAFGELVRITHKSGYLCLTVPNFLSTAFFENVILLLVGQPSYVKSHVCVEKEHIFHVFKLRKLLDQENVRVITIRSVDFLHLPPRVRRILGIGHVLSVISGRLEDFLEDHVSPLRLMGANIGVLVKRE